MIDIQIESAEILTVLQEMFPREYTICVQRVHISKLEGMIKEQGADEVDDEKDQDQVRQIHAHSTP